MSKVPVQKGKISTEDPKTHKMQTFNERVEERRAERDLMREHQKLDLHMPKVK